MKPQLQKWTLLAAFCGVALLLSGCVYLRLLQLKNQLADAEKNFRMDITDGLRIECLNPVLYGDDVRWLGIEPETVTGTPDAERWRVRWLKEPPPGIKEETVYDVELAAAFTNKRMSHVFIPEKYFAFFPKELFVNLLRSTGSAKIDRMSRQADVKAGSDPEKPAVPMPKMSSIEGMLGAPTERKSGVDDVTYLYRYKAVTTGAKAKPIEVSFTFDRATGELRKLTGKLPKGVLNYDLSKAPDKAAPKSAKDKAAKEKAANEKAEAEKTPAP